MRIELKVTERKMSDKFRAIPGLKMEWWKAKSIGEDTIEKKKPYYLLISSKSSPNQLYHWTFHSGCHLNLRKWVCVLVPSPRLLKDPFTSHLLWKYFESHTVTQVGAGTGLGGVGEASKQAAEGRKEQQAAMAWIKAIWIEGTGSIESLWKEANEAKWGNFLVADYSANWIAHIS